MAKAELELITNIEQSLGALKEFQKQATKSVKGVEKQTKKMSKSFDKFSDESSRSLKKVSDSFGAIKTAATAALAFLAARGFVQAIQDVTAAAQVQEDAINNLNTALKQTGDFSEAATRDLQQFASELQSVSTVGDETTLGMLALAKTFGVTNDRAKDLVKAAVELDAATGIGLDSALKNLGKTLSGLTGELGESVPALRELTAEQLKSGDAIDLILSRFGGSAEAKLNTFSGVVQQLKNTFGDLQEEIGFSITQNDFLIDSIKSVSDALVTAINVINGTDDSYNDLFDTIGDVTKQTLSLGVSFLAVSKALKVLPRLFTATFAKISSTIKVFSALSTKSFSVMFALIRLDIKTIRTGFKISLKAALVSIKAFTKASLLSFKAMRLGINITKAALTFGLSIVIDEIIGKIFELREQFGSWSNLAKASIDAVQIKWLEMINVILSNVHLIPFFNDVIDIDSVTKSIVDNEIAVAKLIESITKLASGVAAALPKDTEIKIDIEVEEIELNKAAAQKLQDELQAVISKLAIEFEKTDQFVGPLRPAQELERELGADAPATGIDKVFENIKGFFTDNAFADSINQALDSGFVQTITSGISTAFEVGGTILNGAAEAFGAVFSVAPFESLIAGIENFAKAPEQFEGIFKRAEDIVSNLLKSLPKAFSSIIKKIPKFIDNIIKAFVGLVDIFIKQAPKFVEKLAEGATKLVSAIVKALPKLIRALPAIIKKLASEIPKLIDAFLKGLPDIIKAIAEALPQIIRVLVDAIPAIFEVLADNLGPILEALISGILEAIPEIVFQLVDSLIIKGGLLRIVIAIVKGIVGAIGGIVKGFGSALADLLPNLFRALGQSFGEGIEIDAPQWLDDLALILSGKDLIDRLKELFDFPPWLEKLEKILDDFNPFSDVGGGGEGLVPDDVPLLGNLATGGTVPAGFNNDDFLAGLTSGEMVVPRDDVIRLSDFLDNQKSQQMTGTDNTAQEVTVNIQIGQEELASVILNLNRQGFRLS